MEEYTKLFFWNNQNLFSNNYLEQHLPNTALWKEQAEKVSDVFDVIKKAYDETKTLKLGPGEEAGLEDKFIRPVLQALGFEWDVQPTTKRGLKKKRPDYALFKDKASLTDARKEKDNLVRFFKHPVTILEAKYWGRRLNDTETKDTLDKRDPTAQTVKYLDDVYHASESRIQWAILTNGKHWRLFYYKAASRSGNFFEVDLEEIITRDDKEKFLYFYLFFSKDAFIPDSVSGKTWLDQHLKGTEDYASRISTKLKDLIFDKVFEGLAEGFVHYRKDNPPIPPLAKGGEGGFWKETDESKKAIFRGCLTLLYRLLFVLYAESRNLLPVNEDAYYRVSLLNLKRDIYKDISGTGLDKMSKRSYTYWARLQGLFDIIAKGDPALNVPVYNGGLFENNPPIPPLAKGGKGGLSEQKDSFLSIHKLPDPFLADAIELLTVDHEGIHAPDAPAFIDYSSLSVRHLGDIYEGILEFHIQVAEEDIVEIRKDGKSLWEKALAIKEGIRIYGKRTKGEVYIENSKHERKATGSFYTPHFSVEYIVGNTVGPVLDEKLKIADGLLSQFAAIQRKSLNNQLSADSIRGYKAKIRELEDEIFKTVFGIKVLDPAMGSGHFLVHTVDYISDRIVAFLAGYPDNPVIKKIAELRNEIIKEISKQGVKIDESKLTEVNLIKRMVMKRCIYGVDLNEMAVELAKLSLWLDSFTLGAPLSFLDHHLKCGNSLVGVMDISDVIIPGSEMYGKVQRALSFMLQVSDLTDATITEAKKSYDFYKHVQEEITPIRRRFDVATARYFMDLGKSFSRVEQLAYTMDFENESYPEIVSLCKKALQVAEEKRFFHWKLEYPEVFYTIRGEIENSGFDCVVGNPPYIQLSMDDEIRKEMQNYLLERFTFSMGRLNTFGFFTKLGIELSKLSGFISMIIPNTFLTMPYYSDFREHILQTIRIDSFLVFDFLPFEDAVVENVVFVFQKKDGTAGLDVNRVKIYEASEILKGSYMPTRLIPQSLYHKLFEKAFSPYLEDHAIKLLNKLTNDRTLLGELVEINQAIALKHDRAKYLSLNPQGLQYKKVLDGRDINRYTLDFSGTYLKYEKDAIHSCKREDIFLSEEKLFFRRVGDRIIATVDNEQHYALNTLVVINSRLSFINLRFLLSLLNSSLLTWYFASFLKSTKDVFSEIQARQMEQLPIPRISFTTPEKERKEFFREAVKLYSRSKYEDIIKWADYELALGRNDTSHDFLAYLAEQMIELNKAKGEEIKGFVKWLEREIGAEIDTLANKTAIKEYHEHNFDHLLEVLKKNKNKLIIDPSGRKTQELLEKYFTKSMSVLEPLKEKIKATDNLMDQIVYRLYGLTEEEINIVEGKR